MNKNLIGVALVAVLVIIAIGVYSKDRTPDVQRNLGATASLDGVDNSYVTIGGNKQWIGTIGMTASSSVFCAIQNPYQATTSIVALGAESTSNGIAVANNLSISTSTSRYASSSPALVNNFAMGTGQWSIEFQRNSATSSVATEVNGTGDAQLLAGSTAAGASRYILGPTEWITWRIATSSAGTFSAYNVGTCSATLHKI